MWERYNYAHDPNLQNVAPTPALHSLCRGSSEQFGRCLILHSHFFSISYFWICFFFVQMLPIIFQIKMKQNRTKWLQSFFDSSLSRDVVCPDQSIALHVFWKFDSRNELCFFCKTRFYVIFRPLVICFLRSIPEHNFFTKPIRWIGIWFEPNKPLSIDASNFAHFYKFVESILRLCKVQI